MILIVSKDPLVADQISAMLAEENYANENLPSIEQLGSRLDIEGGLAVFIDIDTVPVDNRCIRKLTQKYPSIYFFCISRDKLHPEIKDAIRHHIYACLHKPVDPDELMYWLRCIDNKDNDSRGPPQHPSKANSINGADFS